MAFTFGNVGTYTAANSAIASQTVTFQNLNNIWVDWGALTLGTITVQAQYSTGTVTNIWPNIKYYQVTEITDSQGNTWRAGPQNWFEQQQQYVVPFTPEELAEQEKRQKINEEKKAKAKVRARELLVSLLTDEQHEQLVKDGAFELQVGERLYRIRPGRKVERLDPKTKKIDVLFCIHPDFSHGLPEDDVAVSQKLLLEADEEKFLKTANQWAA